MGDLVVRPLQEEDVEAIINLDARVTGQRRAGWWRGHLSPYLAKGEPTSEFLIAELCQVAVRRREVVGFAIGDIQSWQFGLPRSGRVVAIAVDPDHRRVGAGRALVSSLLEQFRQMGLDTVRCVVRPGDELDDFFARCGFGTSDFEIRTTSLD